MIVSDLGGHSGCKIYLCEDDVTGKSYVRKISASINYNKRLLHQAKKQNEYLSDSIRVPKIFEQGYTENGLYYFDMEYIKGITLAKYITQVEMVKIRELVENITDGIMSNIGIEKDADAGKIFQSKINDLQRKLSTKNEAIIELALEMLSKHDWSNFAKSSCHGDLTLENIIIKGDKIYLIDFLDSFYDSSLLDAGILLQDVQCLWSYRFDDKIDINTILRLMVFKDILLENVRNKKGQYYVVEVYYGLLLKLIRIFPYTKDEKTYCFLLAKTKAVMELIVEEEACVH